MSPPLLQFASDEARVDFWYTPLARIGDERVFEACWQVLSDDEADRARRFAFERDRRLYLAAHALLRTVLSRYADVAPRDWRFKTVHHGKPVVDPPHGVALRFNLSHTRDMAVCGVTAAGELGVDVECLGRARSDLKLARRYFAPAEVVALERRPPEEMHEAFLEFWTLKESYIKAVGAGLSLPLDSFAFGLSAERPPRLSFTDPAKPADVWHCAQLRLGDGHLAALSLEAAAGPLVVRAAETPPLAGDAEPLRLAECPNRRWQL